MFHANTGRITRALCYLLKTTSNQPPTANQLRRVTRRFAIFAKLQALRVGTTGLHPNTVEFMNTRQNGQETHSHALI